MLTETAGEFQACLSPAVGMEQRAGALLFPPKEKIMTPQNRAPAALHPRTLPTTLPPPASSDYLVFCSFTRITLQKPRSIMLLWKRDSCRRGARDSMSLGAFTKQRRKAPTLFCRLRLMGVLSIPGDKIQYSISLLRSQDSLRRKGPTVKMEVLHALQNPRLGE